MRSMKKILIINLAGVGDLCISSAAIKAIKAHFKNDEIYLLTYARNWQYANDCPYFRRTYFLTPSPSISNLHIIRKLRQLGCDIAINLYNIHTLKGALKMFVLLKIINPCLSVGRNTAGRGFFYNKKINEEPYPQRNDVQTMLDVVDLVGAEGSPDDAELWVEAENDAACSILRKYGIEPNDKFICIHPGASRPSHQWGAERFAQVASRLSQLHGFKIVITGNKNENKIARNLSDAALSPVAVLSGVLSIKELVAVFKKSEMVIINDTGPMHIANILGVPMVVISGCSPKAFLPYRKEKTVILRKDMQGRLEYNSRNKIKALHSISCDDVVMAAEKLIAENKPAHHG